QVRLKSSILQNVLACEEPHLWHVPVFPSPHTENTPRLAAPSSRCIDKMALGPRSSYDEQTKKRVDPRQLRLLERNLANARRDFPEAFFRSSQHLSLLSADGKRRHLPLGQITSSSAGSLVGYFFAS